MQLAQKPAGSRLVLLVVGLFIVLAPVMCVGGHVFATSAPPLARAVELIEQDQGVAAALGSPVKVSLVVTNRLRRNPIRALTGDDDVYVVSTVKGSQEQANFRLSAKNVNGQGWAGTFAVEFQGRPVLRNGSYIQEGAGPLIEGDFAPDGTPRVKKR
ncbi:hypothetical protein [Sorangium sp. So ce385]|uniref:hypothetical protein n=1 Tax=Sorangium sp. So ce385 TaxID=3133308 RepID=UPI003F5B551D